MASGILGTAELAAATNTTLYTAPAGVTASMSVSLCNRSATAATVRVALAASASPTNAEFIHYDMVLEGNASFERTGLVVSDGDLVVVRSSVANVSAVAYGFEE